MDNPCIDGTGLSEQYGIYHHSAIDTPFRKRYNPNHADSEKLLQRSHIKGFARILPQYFPMYK